MKGQKIAKLLLGFGFLMINQNIVSSHGGREKINRDRALRTATAGLSEKYKIPGKNVADILNTAEVLLDDKLKGDPNKLNKEFQKDAQKVKKLKKELNELYKK